MKIQAKDLRIGNWIVSNKEFHKVRTISDKYVEIVRNNKYTIRNYEQIEPIPITPEILLKAGFVTDDITFYKNGFYLGWYLRDEFYYLPAGQLSLRNKNQVKYVHQLQNLVHSLTGEELTIEL